MVAADPTAEDRDDWEGHWERYADSAEANPAQEFRRRAVFDRLGEVPPGAYLLDIGCGQGDLLRDLSVRYPAIELAGVDQSSSGLAAAAEKVPTARLAKCDLLTGADFPDDLVGRATHATCSEVLEHVDDPTLLLTHARRLLAPGCRLVVTVPGGPRSAYDRHIGHRQHFDVVGLTDALTDAGFVSTKVWRTGFPAFNAYKLLVIARGDRLIEDAQRPPGKEGTKLASLAMAAFRPLFRFTVPDFRFGWQLLATAHVPYN